MCDCITTMNDLLKPMNARLVVAIAFPRDGTPGYAAPHVSTELIERRRDGKRAPVIFPTFCPFCGERYRPDAPKVAEAQAHG